MSRPRFLVAFIALAPANATACGLCVAAAFDSFLPPIGLWCLLAISWFLSQGLISTTYGLQLGQPRLVGSLVIVVLAAAIGGAILGPIVVLPLSLPPAIAFLRIAFRRGARIRAQQVVLAVGSFHLLVAAALGFYAAHIRHTRTEAQYIVAWGGTAPGHGRFLALQRHEPSSLTEYRYIVAHGSGFPVGEAAQRIAVIGTPSEDVPLLAAALKRQPWDPTVTAMLEQALAQLKAKRPGA